MVLLIFHHHHAYSAPRQRGVNFTVDRNGANACSRNLLGRWCGLLALQQPRQCTSSLPSPRVLKPITHLQRVIVTQFA